MTHTKNWLGLSKWGPFQNILSYGRRSTAEFAAANTPPPVQRIGPFQNIYSKGQRISIAEPKLRSSALPWTEQIGPVQKFTERERKRGTGIEALAQHYVACGACCLISPGARRPWTGSTARQIGMTRHALLLLSQRPLAARLPVQLSVCRLSVELRPLLFCSCCVLCWLLLRLSTTAA